MTKAENIYICRKGATNIYGLWLDLCDCDKREPEGPHPICWDNINVIPDPDDPDREIEEPQACDAEPHLCIPAAEAREFLTPIIDAENAVTAEEVCRILTDSGTVDKARALLAKLEEEK